MTFTPKDSNIPDIRRRVLNDLPCRTDRDFVLYWNVGQRRTRFNFALQRAVELSRSLGKPLLIFEPLRCDYPWASRRHHQFIIEGMAANAKEVAGTGAHHLTFVERSKGDGKGLLEALSQRACAVITDDCPVFFLPQMTAAGAQAISVSCEAVDSNGLLPLRSAPKVYKRAHDFRRFLHKNLGPHLLETPVEKPLDDLETAWSNETSKALAACLEVDGHRRGVLNPVNGDGDDGSCGRDDFADIKALVAATPVSDDVAAGAVRGGPPAARELLTEFLDGKLERYVDDRNNLDQRATSELSPHLHYGHISAHEILVAIADREDWSPMDISSSTTRGQRLGWWGLSEPIESFLDELVTWRELGYNMAWQVDDYHRYDSLPDWAKATLAEHEKDERPYLYTLEQLDQAQTHDEVWNAAQRELRRDGRIHNYLRMLWGKKILEWSPSPRDAAEILVELNNKYSLDGRDPNSYSGIYWCLGRYDRAWGPEREIFGKIRYMSSASARRKLKLNTYLEKYGPSDSAQASLF